MEAVLALVGVALGAGLAPTLDWARQRARRREERRREMLEMVASYVTLVGDQLVAESEMQTELELGLTGSEQWSAEIGFRTNAARWRLALVAPPDVADRGESFAATAESLRRAIRRAGGHGDGTVIAAEYDEWKGRGETLDRDRSSPHREGLASPTRPRCSSSAGDARSVRRASPSLITFT